MPPSTNSGARVSRGGARSGAATCGCGTGIAVRRRGFLAASGFSLVEITLALGIVSFGLVATLGTMAVGLNTVRDATTQAAASNIARQLRGDLQQISFATNAAGNSGALNIQSLNQTNYYYTQEGVPSTASGAHYKAAFEVAGASVEGTGGSNDVAAFAPASAKMVKVTLSYPQSAPENNQKRLVFSLLLAKQTTR